MEDSKKETAKTDTVTEPKLENLPKPNSSTSTLKTSCGGVMVSLLDAADFVENSKRRVSTQMKKNERFDKTIDEVVEVMSEFFYKSFKIADQPTVTATISKILRSTLTPDVNMYNAFKNSETKMKDFKQELAEKTKELKILKSGTDRGMVELKEKLELAEKAKRRKDQDIEHINKRLRNSENEVSQLENLVKGLKQEKSKKDVGLAGFDKMKKELNNVKEELKRVERIAISDKTTIQKLLDENQQLQKILAAKTAEVSRIQSEWKKADLLMKTAREETKEDSSSASEKQKLALEKYELQKLEKIFTDFTIKAEKESVLEAFENDGGASKNAIKKARMQLEEHFKASEQAAKVVRENLKLIENHLNFTVDSLAIVPFVPPPFTAEMSQMNEVQNPAEETQNFDDGAKDTCGLCSEPLKGSKSGLVACNTCNNHWHYQCVVHWYEGNSTAYHQH